MRSTRDAPNLAVTAQRALEQTSPLLISPVGIRLEPTLEPMTTRTLKLEDLHGDSWNENAYRRRTGLGAAQPATFGAGCQSIASRWRKRSCNQKAPTMVLASVTRPS